MADGMERVEWRAKTISGTTLKYTNISGTVMTSTSGTITTVSGTYNYAGTTTTENLVVGADAEFAPGSPYGEGITFNGWAAGAIITGGMWVIGSNGMILPAAASQDAPLGVCKSTTASGATCEVLVHGLHYMTLDGDTNAGVGVKVGAGAALNTVQPAGAGSSVVGKAVIGASSGGKGLIYIG